MALDIYTQKKRSKILLFVLALLIIGGSIYYTNHLVRQFAKQERSNVRLWAAAVQRKANLVKYTESFFKQLQQEEHKRVELLAEVYKQILSNNNSPDLTFYVDIIHNNNTIPIILTNESGKIQATKNLDFPYDTITYLKGELLNRFSVYEPIEVPYAPHHSNYLFYQDSKFFKELKEVLNDYISAFISEVALNSSSVPVIITDSTRQNVIQFGNLNDVRMSDPVYVHNKLIEMEDENQPIKVSFGEQGTAYIFYQDSELLTIMRFFPIAQILIIAVFLTIAYYLFSYARKAEQNRVWAGMAKETAHQIGTPLSSIMAWMELLKMGEGNPDEAIVEIQKDINRLEMITERFSKIGSTPKLIEYDLLIIINSTLDYMKPRTPKKVTYNAEIPATKEILVPINPALFSWVLENLIKNAIDAMEGEGKITIKLKEDHKHVILDIIDTGKGIAYSEQKTIFNPGYTSKARGWGLGLSLANRIIRDYHNGKIFVKSSTQGKGTTFRIILKKY